VIAPSLAAGQPLRERRGVGDSTAYFRASRADFPNPHRGPEVADGRMGAMVAPLDPDEVVAGLLVAVTMRT